MSVASLVLLGQSLAAFAVFFGAATLVLCGLRLFQSSPDRALEAIHAQHQTAGKFDDEQDKVERYERRQMSAVSR